MKNKIKELDVDFIGGQQPITKEEEFAISAFIRKQKEKRQLETIRKAKTKASQNLISLLDKARPPSGAGM